MGKCVVVADAREVVVAGVGVAAGAVFESVADGVVVVSLHAADVGGVKQREDLVWVGPEAAHVAEAVDFVGAEPLSLGEGCGEAEVVVVDAAEDNDAARWVAVGCQVRHRRPSAWQL